MPLRSEVSRLGRALHVKASVPGAVNTARTVILTYRVRRALMPVDGHEELYWNVTGSEWDVPIRQAEAVVSSPASIPLEQIRAIAYTGPAGTAGADYTEDRADTYLTFRTTRPLRAREGLTVAVGWPPGAIRGPSAARRALWWLGDNWPFALPPLTIAGALIMWRVYGRDPGGARTIKPEYAPPEGLGPAAGGALVTERAEPRDVVATLVDLAVRGYIRIEEIEPDFGEKDFVFHRLKPLSGDPTLKPLELYVLSRLFGSDWGLNSRHLADLRRDYDNVFPTGKIVPVKGTPYDFQAPEGKPLDDQFLDDNFSHLESKSGPVVVTITDPAAHYGVHIEGLSPHIKTLQVYAPPSKNFIAVEHQFNFADPFGKEWGKMDTQMITLAPGQSTQWHVRLKVFIP